MNEKECLEKLREVLSGYNDSDEERQETIKDKLSLTNIIKYGELIITVLKMMDEGNNE